MALRDPELEDVADKQYRYYLEENEKLVTAVADMIGFDYSLPIPVSPASSPRSWTAWR